MEKSEAILKTIFKNTQVSFLLLVPDCNVLAINRYLQDDYLEQTEFKLTQGVNFLEFTLPVRRHVPKENFGKVLKTGLQIKYETVYDKTGIPKYVDITISPVKIRNSIVGSV